MHTFHLWIYNAKDVVTYAKTGKARTWVTLLYFITIMVWKGRRIRPHLKNAKEIHIVLDGPSSKPRQKPPAKIFLRKACVFFGLSPEESNVMLCLLKECDNKEIATHLNKSSRTVETQRKSIFHKLKEHDLGAVRSKIKEQAALFQSGMQTE
jgi:DNA-binding NarL/FixJ family response regulator